MLMWGNGVACVCIYQELISHMLLVDQEDRYSAAEMLEHPWVAVSSPSYLSYNTVLNFNASYMEFALHHEFCKALPSVLILEFCTSGPADLKKKLVCCPTPKFSNQTSSNIHRLFLWWTLSSHYTFSVWGEKSRPLGTHMTFAKTCICSLTSQVCTKLHQIFIDCFYGSSQVNKHQGLNDLGKHLFAT